VTDLDAAPADLLTNADYKTTKIVLRRIEPGTFTMGSPEGELGRGDWETQHEVELTQAFYVGIFEVTHRQWERVMGTDPSFFEGDTRPVEQVSWNTIRGGDWPGSPAGSGAPGVGTFVDKLRSRTGGMAFDLPTEAQWEYACRAGTTRAYNDQTKNGGTGSDCLTAWEADSNLEPLAWYSANSGSLTSDVGGKQANAWGLYDMHGNVWEWCLDWYDDYAGAVSDPRGPDSGSFRAARGGGWSDYGQYCRVAVRNGYWPDSWNPYVGFRLVRTAL
jgi:formylglycine-generating enzyme required for sulfatase activity